MINDVFKRLSEEKPKQHKDESGLYLTDPLLIRFEGELSIAINQSDTKGVYGDWRHNHIWAYDWVSYLDGEDESKIEWMYLPDYILKQIDETNEN